VCQSLKIDAGGLGEEPGGRERLDSNEKGGNYTRASVVSDRGKS